MKMKKRFLSILLTLVMVLGLMPGMSLTAYADSDEAISIGGSDASGTHWTYVSSTGTLTLNGYNYSGNGIGVYYSGSGQLTILVEGDNSIDSKGQNVGIRFSDGNKKLMLSGTGSLKITSENECAIYTQGDMEFAGGTIKVSGNTGIYNHDHNVTISGGKVTAIGNNGGGIYTKNGGKLFVTGGELVAIGTNGGIKQDNSPKGVVNSIAGIGWTDATGTDGKADIAISTDGQTLDYKKVQFPAYTVTYTVENGTWSDDSSADITETVASGAKPVNVPTGMKASEGYEGGAWDTDPTDTTITEATTFTYSFTAKQAAKVTKAPAAKSLSYTGSAQELVTAGEAEGGTMQYAIGKNDKTAPTDGWKTSIPTATDAGTYTVWYKVVGDEDHADSEPQKVTSTIAAKLEPEPAGAITLTGSGHVQNVGDVAGKASGKGVKVGTEGRGLRLEALSLALPKDVEGGIEYRAHVQNKGWGDWAADGRECGTRGSGLRLEAVQVRLTGKLADTHSVWYRAHVQNLGTLGWSRDGQAAGTAGRGLRVESLEVCVLPKGEVPESGAGSRASFVGAVGGSAHSQNVGWAGASPSLSFGTTGRGLRLEAVRLNAPSLPEACGISYEAHVQNVGWQGARTSGKVAGTTGRGLRTEAVRISLTGEAAKKGGYSVWYRVHSQNQGWLGWAHDGADAGTVGRGLRAEAVQVQVLPQGQVPAGYDASKAACVR